MILPLNAPFFVTTVDAAMQKAMNYYSRNQELFTKPFTDKSALGQVSAHIFF